MRLTFGHIGWVAIASLFLSTARGAFIEGQIGFAGGVTLDSSTLANATQLTFNPPSTPVAGVTLVTGDFFTVGTFPGTLATFTTDTLNFGAGAGPLVPSINPLWSVGGFSYELSAITEVTSQSEVASTGVLTIRGTGVVSHASFDTTATEWTMTINVDAEDNLTFGFSADAIATGGAGAVPEPTTLGLLGLSTAFLGLRSRRRRARSNQ